MPFRDEYTNFNFNNQDSSAFKVWVTNNRDIKIALTPNFSDSFISPQFGGVRYLNGTTVDKTDITVNCIAINVNMNEWRAICNWLAPNKIGKLNFDFNKNSYYNVKLSKGVSSSSFYNMGVHDKFNGDYRIIEFTLEFTTVGDYAAIGNTNSTSLEWKEEADVNYINNYYCRNYVIEPQEISNWGYVGNITIDFRDVDSGTYQFGPYNKDTGIHNILLYININENQLGWGYSQTGPWNNFNGLYTFPSGYYYLSIVGSEEGPDLPVFQKAHLFNVGEYDEYPILVLNEIKKGFKVYFNDDLFYHYEFHSDTEKNNIVIDTKTGIVSYRGRPLEISRSFDGSILTKKSYNKGIPILPSGNPELHLAKIKEKFDNGTRTMKLLLDYPLINKYNTTSLGINMFTGVDNDVSYSTDPYNVGEYPYELENYVSAINCEVIDEDKRIVTIELGQWFGNIDSNKYNVGNKLYVSFCKPNFLRIENLDDETSFIGTYSSASRGAV